MNLEIYYKELKNTEDNIRDLLLDLKVNIKFDRFICFSSLFLYTQKKPFKLIASETFEDEEGNNKKTIKVQIIHLDKKLSKMTAEEIQNRLSKLMKLYSLFNKYKSLLEAYRADFDLEYSEYIINFQLSGASVENEEEFYNQFDDLVNKTTKRYKKFIEERKKIGILVSYINQYKYKKIIHYTHLGEYLK